MNAPANISAVSGLELLRKPFPEHQISKLPKPYKKDSAKGNCKECGGYHGLPAAHLDYVGHAALTDRLLDADPLWTWEPLATTDLGLPAFDQTGGLWIKLTVCGVTRLGYGHAAPKSYGDPGMREKEVIGDALRNAAMRFGAALDLWHKGDLHQEDQSDGGGDNSGDRTVSPAAGTDTLRQQLEQSVAEADKPKRGLDGPYTSKDALRKAFKALRDECHRCGDEDTLDCLLIEPSNAAVIEQCERDAPHLLHGDDLQAPEWRGLNAEIRDMRLRFRREATERDVPNILQAG